MTGCFPGWKRFFSVGAALFFLFRGGFLFASGTAEEPEMLRFRFPVMGTEAVILLYATPDRADRALAGVHAAFARVLRMANPYDPESEVSRLNRTASEKPFVCSGDLWTILQAAREAWSISGGAFDVTARPLLELWGFYRRGSRLHPPDDAERMAALKKVGLDKVIFDDSAQSVSFTVPGMALDLGGLAKGYAVDLALAAVRKEGIRRGMINLGGNLGLLEPPPDKDGWPVRFLAPDGSLSAPVRLKNLAVSTSGDYERNVLIDGRKYGHIVDPRTGIPVRRSFSVSALAPDALRADILSTVFFLEPGTVLPAGEKWKDIRIIRNECEKRPRH